MEKINYTVKHSQISVLDVLRHCWMFNLYFNFSVPSWLEIEIEFRPKLSSKG